ncbi:MAG: PAS domain S-box protein, partial [Pseudomonadota bacterium]
MLTQPKKNNIQFKAIFEQVRKDNQLSKEKNISKNFLNFIKNCPIGIVQIDDELNICAINACAEKIFGFVCLEVFGKKIDILLPEEFLKKSDSSFLNFLSSIKLESSYFIASDRKGKKIPVQITSIPQLINNKLYFFLTILDQSELQITKLVQQAEIQRFKAVFD